MKSPDFTLPMLGVVLICLKLTDHIDIGWGVVLLPLYAPFVLYGAVVLAAVGWAMIHGGKEG